MPSRAQLVEMLAEPSPDTAASHCVGYYLVTNAVDRLHLDQPDGIHDRRLFTLWVALGARRCSFPSSPLSRVRLRVHVDC